VCHWHEQLPVRLPSVDNLSLALGARELDLLWLLVIFFPLFLGGQF